jgi:hypothetical protein
MWYFVIGIIGAIICGAAAAARGRFWLGWFIYGLFLWPIALINLFVLPRNEKALEERKVSTGELVKCPHCAELIRPEAKVCRFCHRDVTPASTDLATDTSEGLLADLSNEQHEEYFKALQAIRGACIWANHYIEEGKKDRLEKTVETCLSRANAIDDEFYRSAALAAIADLLDRAGDETRAEEVRAFTIDFMREKAVSGGKP